MHAFLFPCCSGRKDWRGLRVVVYGGISEARCPSTLVDRCKAPLTTCSREPRLYTTCPPSSRLTLQLPVRSCTLCQSLYPATVCIRAALQSGRNTHSVSSPGYIRESGASWGQSHTPASLQHRFGHALQRSSLRRTLVPRSNPDHTCRHISFSLDWERMLLIHVTKVLPLLCVSTNARNAVRRDAIGHDVQKPMLVANCQEQNRCHTASRANNSPNSTLRIHVFFMEPS